MSLIQEINRTETEKNKTKQVATNIDNKLVELGGERATDLADVPNKIDETIKNNLRKSAVIDLGGIQNEGKDFFRKDFSDVLNFKPQKAILEFKLKGNEPSSNGSPNYKILYTKYAVEMEQGKTVTLALQVSKNLSYSSRIYFTRSTFKLSDKKIELDNPDARIDYHVYWLILDRITFIE